MANPKAWEVEHIILQECSRGRPLGWVPHGATLGATS